jgi:hypothetical protein
VQRFISVILAMSNYGEGRDKIDFSLKSTWGNREIPSQPVKAGHGPACDLTYSKSIKGGS